jgi:hypothetical protein
MHARNKTERKRHRAKGETETESNSFTTDPSGTTLAKGQSTEAVLSVERALQNSCSGDIIEQWTPLQRPGQQPREQLTTATQQALRPRHCQETDQVRPDLDNRFFFTICHSSVSMFFNQRAKYPSTMYTQGQPNLWLQFFKLYTFGKYNMINKRQKKR